MNDGDQIPESEDPAYEIGYKRPPKDHQFKKGKSGNPKGRPKGSKSFATLVRENLAKPIQVKLDGKLRTVSMGEAILMRSLRDAVSGGKRAAEQGLKLMERFDQPEEKEAEPEWDWDQLTEEELTIVERLIHKASGKMDEYEELERRRERDDEAARAERVRIFGPGAK